MIANGLKQMFLNGVIRKAAFFEQFQMVFVAIMFHLPNH